MLSSFHLSPMLACLGLFATTFLQEGVALTAGALLIVRGDVYPTYAGLSLALGMLTGDYAIYGLGRAARQSRWAKRLITKVDLNTASTWSDKRLFFIIATSHLVPWLLFPTFVAFGWFKLPFRRFALTSVMFAMLYVPIALFILTRAGHAAWPYLGEHPWLLALTGSALVTALLAAFWLRVRAAN